MNGGIFLIQQDGELVELSEQTYDSESLLQSFLVQYPNLLAGNQIDRDDPRRWLLVSREMGIPIEEGGGNWMSVDHLFLDQDAIPTLVEVKRSTDTRIRREVVGQMLDYASNAVVYWPIETIRQRFNLTCETNGQVPDQVLQEFLGEEGDPATFWEQVLANLTAGKIRMLFIADQIPPELQRIVEFLNQQMNPAEVLAIEIKQFAGQGLRTLVPRVLGQTMETERKKRPATEGQKQWDEASFFEELVARHGEEDAEVARKILTWARAKTNQIWWGKGKRSGSFVPTYFHKGIEHQIFAVWTYGTVEIYFYWYMFKSPFESAESRLRLLQRLNQIAGVNISEDKIGRRPSIPLTVFRDDESLQKFLDTFDWFLDEIRAN